MTNQEIDKLLQDLVDDSRKKLQMGERTTEQPTNYATVPITPVYEKITPAHLLNMGVSNVTNYDALPSDSNVTYDDFLIYRI